MSCHDSDDDVNNFAIRKSHRSLQYYDQAKHSGSRTLMIYVFGKLSPSLLSLAQGLRAQIGHPELLVGMQLLDALSISLPLTVVLK